MSGYSPFLNSYLNRIDPNKDINCPKCLAQPHTTGHLFNCPMDPTGLEVYDLWTRPIEVANFLRLPTEPGPEQDDFG